MKIPVVTAANEAYWPGVVALYNSIKAHYPDCQFHALLEGGASLEGKAAALGIDYTMNPDVAAGNYPVTKNRPENTAMVHFYRLLVPELFASYKKSIYIDCDSLVLQPLDKFLDFDAPVAACESNSELSKEIQGETGRGFISCLMIFNHAKWLAQNIGGLCREVMNNPPAEFYTGDQAVLNWVLKGKWHKLPVETVAHAGHGSYFRWPKSKIHILHFLGTNPWDEVPTHLLPYPKHKMDARAIWDGYYRAA